MNYHREEMKKFISEAHDLINQKRYDVLHVFLVNYGPQLVDKGVQLDRLMAENERLTAIVTLIELKKERDAAVEVVGKIRDEIIDGKIDTGDQCRALLDKIEKLCKKAVA